MTDRFTPHTVSLVIRSLQDTGEWRGTRAGVRLRLKLSDQLHIEGKRVLWCVWIPKNWKDRKTGRADTVKRALEEAEAAILS